MHSVRTQVRQRVQNATHIWVIYLVWTYYKHSYDSISQEHELSRTLPWCLPLHSRLCKLFRHILKSPCCKRKTVCKGLSYQFRHPRRSLKRGKLLTISFYKRVKNLPSTSVLSMSKRLAFDFDLLTGLADNRTAHSSGTTTILRTIHIFVTGLLKTGTEVSAKSLSASKGWRNWICDAEAFTGTLADFAGGQVFILPAAVLA